MEHNRKTDTRIAHFFFFFLIPPKHKNKVTFPCGKKFRSGTSTSQLHVQKKTERLFKTGSWSQGRDSQKKHVSYPTHFIYRGEHLRGTVQFAGGAVTWPFITSDRHSMRTLVHVTMPLLSFQPAHKTITWAQHHLIQHHTSSGLAKQGSAILFSPLNWWRASATRPTSFHVFRRINS